MTDDLAKLKSALGATSPQAPAAARERAISEAMAAFDRHRQGSVGEKRHKGRVPKRGTSWIRRLAMPMSRPTLAFAGSAAMLVVAGIVSHQVLLSPQPPSWFVGDAAAPGPTGVDDGRVATETPGTTGMARGEQPPAMYAAEGVTEARQAREASARIRRDEAVRLAEEVIHKKAMHADEAEGRALAHRRVERNRAPVPSGPASVVRAWSRVESEPLDSAVYEQYDRLGEMSERSATQRYLKTYPATESSRTRARQAEPRLVDESVERPYPEQGRDRFAEFDPNPVKVVVEEPVSTFSIDVDTASYSFMRASLNDGHLPDKDAVRPEEFINYFPYDYAPPESRDTPFATHVVLMPAPWNHATRLLHIGIKGYELDRGTAPGANLVFLIDTSGSMDEPNKLPLLISSFRLLLNALSPDDRVAIVTYAGSAGVVLPPTPVSDRAGILAGLERLEAGGSTAGAEGIRQAYRLAEQHMTEDSVNRVILATDGDFNVGITDPEELEDYIAHKRSSGVFLSVLGFGMGNYNDELMQRLAQSGNGNAAYIDTLSEARKVLVEEATSTLFPIAGDVKIQVEFNPAIVSEYRLIGFETRMLAREDFRDDKVDAGEIGAGHTVTAIYEVTPAGSGAERVARLRYQDKHAEPKVGFDDELAFLKIRYKLPDSETSTLIARPITAGDAFESVDAAPRDVRFSTAVAAFGQLLRGGRYTGDYGYDDVIALAQGARGDDSFDYRNEFVGLVRLAQSVTPLNH